MHENESSSQNRVLILFAHPALEKSRVNRRMIAAVRDLPGVTFHDLYEAYPDFDIWVENEKELVEDHDTLVFQHPMFWYSSPAILKQWQDLVLEHGWAFGSTGTALHGKRWVQALTMGGREDSYMPDGLNYYTIRQLLTPFERTAALCGLEWLPPFCIYGTHLMPESAIGAHVDDYVRVVEGLRDRTLDLAAAADWPHLNADMAALTGHGAGGGSSNAR